MSVWRQIQRLLPPHGRALLAFVAVESLIAGLLEATLLVLVVSAALSLTEDTQTVPLQVPFLGEATIHPAPALASAAVAGLAMSALHLHVAWSAARVSAGVLENARERAIRAFGAAAWSSQSEEREGRLQETVSSLAVQCSALALHVSNLLGALLGLVALLAIAIVVDVLVTAMVVIFGACLFVLLRPVGRMTGRRSTEFVNQNSDFTERIAEWSGLALELRVFGVQETQVRRLAEHNRAASRSMRATRFASRAGGELYRDLAILFLIGAVSALHLAGNVELVSVGAVVLLIVRSLAYAQMTNYALQQINEQRPNLDSLVARLEVLRHGAEMRGTERVSTFSGAALRHVDYDYAPDRPGIAGIDLDITPGEAIGVIGPSGSGKSTLAQVLLRVRTPTRGELTVSDVPYRQIEGQSWARLVALVPQEPRLFQATVAENIRFLRSDIDDERIRDAAAKAHVLDDIERLPNGFDTRLGPRGGGLSGGQKQRIAIARALAGDASLLVLDEPTSALDAHSEQLLQRTIEELKGHLTLVIIAHRVTTLACCDRVIAMSQGRIKAVGTLAEALAEVELDGDLVGEAPGSVDE